MGGALEPDNKQFKELAAKARVEAEKKPPPQEHTKPQIRMPVQVPKGMQVPKPKVAEEKAPADADANAAAKANELRGYKVTADGRKTTFFNHDLDDEAKRLIGDIRPKKLEADATPDAVATPAGASSWNSAGARNVVGKLLQRARI